MALFTREIPGATAHVTSLRTHGTAMVASSTRATGTNAQQFRQLIQPWQQNALLTYQTVGECWYAAQFYARTLRKVRTFAGIRDENGEVKEIEDKTHPAVQAWDRVQDVGGGGRGQLQASYGQLQFLIGDGYLTATQDPIDPEEEAWEYLSPNELRVNPGKPPIYTRYAAPGLPPEQLSDIPDEEFAPLVGVGDKQAVVWRLYRRDPQFSKWADSPMRGVLALFEELVLLQLAVGARAKSRAAGAGILYIPNELSFGQANHQANDNPTADPMMQRFELSMVTPIKDPGAASAVVPMIMRGPAKIGDIAAKDALFHLPIHNPLETYPEESLRTELIKRIAQGLDIPAEVLTGMSDANHWTAWQIDEASWTAHVQPMCEQMCSDFGSAYLRPACKQANVKDWQQIVVGYDAAAVINHPDRVSDGIKLQAVGALSDEKLREIAGFTENDKPTDAEHLEYLAIKLRDKTFLQDEGVTPVAAGAIDKASAKNPTPVPVAPGQEPAQSPGTKAQAAEISKTPPSTLSSTQLQNEDSNLSLGASALVERVIGAAELAVERTRELAGSRLRSKAKGCSECRELIDPVGNSLVASALGETRVHEVAPGMDLTSGGTDTFKVMLSRWGVPVETTERLAELVEKYAASQLWSTEPEALPEAFAGYVRKVL